MKQIIIEDMKAKDAVEVINFIKDGTIRRIEPKQDYDNNYTFTLVLEGIDAYTEGDSVFLREETRNLVLWPSDYASIKII